MSEDKLIQLLEEYRDASTRTVTIPLDEYEALKAERRSLYVQISSLESDVDWYRHRMEEIGVGAMHPELLIPGSVSRAVEHNPISNTSRYIVRFDLIGKAE